MTTPADKPAKCPVCGSSETRLPEYDYTFPYPGYAQLVCEKCFSIFDVENSAKPPEPKPEPLFGDSEKHCGECRSRLSAGRCTNSVCTRYVEPPKPAPPCPRCDERHADDPDACLRDGYKMPKPEGREAREWWIRGHLNSKDENDRDKILGEVYAHPSNVSPAQEVHVVEYSALEAALAQVTRERNVLRTVIVERDEARRELAEIKKRYGIE